MLKLKFVLACILCSASISICSAQQSLVLNDVIGIAQKSSPSYYRAQSRALNSMYAYRYFRSGQMPQLVLGIDNYSSFLGETVEVQQPNGPSEFRRRSTSVTSLGLGLRQQVPWTGGTFSFRSDLTRNDQFSPESKKSFLATPFSIRYDQPSIMYNAYRWAQKISPVLYEESKRQYIEDLERVALDASDYFFRALGAQVQVKILQLNVENTDTLYKISKGRYDLGKIAENELLQIELSLLNARNNLDQAIISKEVAYQELKRFLNMPKDAEIDLVAPNTIPLFDVPLDKAVSESSTNRQAVLSFRRRRLEAEQSVAQARGSNGYEFNLSATLGRSNNDILLRSAYSGGDVQQNLSVGVSIPIMDWGRARNRVRQAKANRDLAEIDIQQDERIFEQEIYLQTQQFNIQKRLVASAAKADTIAQLRYEITKQRYLIGKISITDLNLAQQEKDQNSRGYINALLSFWNAYYTVRRLTLYDFERNEKIKYEYNEK
ncbi:TolC family protein [Chitinophaga niabensis]|uniref:Outer membrane protein TolC n=1 Tax=Chitinophaga niabensis TaxID=536979 RepID=A0A1N6K6J4_9BACT|nr:TolC family protein [Chitinophaga niabensis]SIO51937.1 Outer membrane protein TolC [Chitinophaga niabensis]